MKRKRLFDQKGIEAFAEHLKMLRKKHGYSQEKLANESEITLSQIARIETARINPSLSTAFKIARTLNISVKELFDFELPD